MTPSLAVAPMRWWHVADVLLIETELFGADHWGEAMFWNELANSHYYVVLLDGTEVVGYGGVALSPPTEAWINNIGVRPDRQRRGHGRLLLDSLLGYGRAHGARFTLLEVAADNVAAQALYDAYGFDVVGVRRGYYQPSNTDALVMKREER